MLKYLLQFTAIIILLSAGSLFAQAGEDDFANLNYSSDVTKTGTSAASFLEIGVGAKAKGLGGAFTALASDVSALYWNPGGLVNTENVSFSVNHSEWLADTKSQFFGLVFPFSNNIALGFSFNTLNYGDKRPVRTIAQPEGTGEFYDALDLAVGATFAMRVTDRFSFGITGKYISQKIWHETASALALDVGVLYKTQLEGFNIGTSISNFGSDMKMEGRDLVRAYDADDNNYSNDKLNVLLKTDEFPLPLIFRFGLSYEFEFIEDNGLTIAADLVHPSNNNIYANTGIEYNFQDLLKLRAGFETLFHENSEQGLTLGVGIDNPFANTLDFSLNYAYVDWGRLGYIQQFSIDLGF